MVRENGQRNSEACAALSVPPARPAVPREIHASDSGTYCTGVAPEDLSASGGWHWGNLRITQLLECLFDQLG